MKIYPQTPEEWDDANNTLFKTFELRSSPDIECLIRLVKDNISDRGNSGFLRARLLGILFSYNMNANSLFWEKHYHPKTYKVRILIKKMKKSYHRLFKTKYFKSEVMLCNMALEVVNEIKNEES